MEREGAVAPDRTACTLPKNMFMSIRSAVSIAMNLLMNEDNVIYAAAQRLDF